MRSAAERVTEEGGIRHFHVDHLGTPRLITDSLARKMAADDYLPFGRELTSWRQEMTAFDLDRPEHRHFTGHERDFTANIYEEHENYLDYMHARYYEPRSGRFLEVDPGRDWNPSQPQRWNLYSYARNNPVDLTDPTGKWGWSDLKLLLGRANDAVDDFWKGIWPSKTTSDHDRQTVKLAGDVEVTQQQAASAQWGNERVGIEEGISTVGAELTKQAAVELTFETVGYGLKQVRKMGPGRLKGYIRGNTESVGGLIGATAQFEKIAGRAPIGPVDRAIVGDMEVFFRTESKSGVPKIEIINHSKKTYEKISYLDP